MGQKQKTERKKRERKRERLNDGENNGQATHGARKHAWRTQAAWANILATVAPILLFPAVSDRVAEKTTEGLNKDFKTIDGTIHFYFEEKENVEILDKVTKTRKTVSEREGLKFVILNWVNSVFIYLTKTDDDDDEELIDEDGVEEEMQSGNATATDLVHTIDAVLPANEENKHLMDEVRIVVPILAETIPAVNRALPDINHLVNNVLPVFRLLRR